MTLAAEGVAYRVGGAALLRDVSCVVEPRRLLAIVGRNGTGKSTLLGVLSGRYRAHEGRVSLDAIPLRQWRGGDLARRRACLMSSSPIFFPFRASDIIFLGAEPHRGRVSGERVDAAVAELARRYEIEPLLARRCDTLSSGELQRVHLARAMLQIVLREEGEVYLLLDEPETALDLVYRRRLWEHLLELKERGVGVALVTHDLAAAKEHADVVCVLKDGRRHALDTPTRALDAEHLQAAFGVRQL